MSENNHQIRLAAHPSGVPKPSDWELTKEPIPVPCPGELVVAIEYFSIDPAMRRWIAPSHLGQPVAVGDVMEASAIGRVTASEHPGFAVGEQLYGGFGVQEFACSDGTDVTKLDPSLGPLTAYLGVRAVPEGAAVDELHRAVPSHQTRWRAACERGQQGRGAAESGREQSPPCRAKEGQCERLRDTRGRRQSRRAAC